MAMAVLMMMGVVFWTWILGLTDHESETKDGGRRIKKKEGERKKKKKGRWSGPSKCAALLRNNFPFPPRLSRSRREFAAGDGSLYYAPRFGGEGGRPASSGDSSRRASLSVRGCMRGYVLRKRSECVRPKDLIATIKTNGFGWLVALVASAN